MTITDKYLYLLRTACFGTTYEGTVAKEELQEILRLCALHGTGPLVYNELLKSLTPHAPSPIGEGELLTPELRLQMKQVCMQNMLLQSQWEQIIAKVWKSLSSEGERCVHAVLMKGFAYAHNYPLPYLRSWGDLDVWVGPEQYHKACGLLREAFPEAKHHDEEWDELKHYCFVFPNDKAIELHRVSMDFLSPKDQAYWNSLTPVLKDTPSPKGEGEDYYIEVGGIRVPVFEPKFDLLFCFMHSWEHFTGTGIPLKQVCDMALLVKKLHTGSDPTCSFKSIPQINEYLRKHLTALGMMEVWKAYGYMACKAMGMDWAEWPLLLSDGVLSAETRKYGERLYEQVIREGQCRKKDYGEASDRYEARENARKMNILARKWLTLKQRIVKAHFLHYFAP